MTKPSRRIVSFELPKAVFDALQEEAVARGTGSIHQRCRELMVDHFSASNLEEVHDRLASLDIEVAQLGELNRRVAYAILVYAANWDCAKANAWIRENLPRNGDRP